MAKRPLYQTVDGIRCPVFFLPKCVQEALEYKPRDDDIFIVTYPKCGTTWMQNVVYQILRGGIPLNSQADIHRGMPFIEVTGKSGIEMMPRPGAIKTHLPYTRLVQSPTTKYIFVIRNPRDTCVSYYHHVRMIPGYMFWDGKFDDLFEAFISGEVDYGDYFDHLLTWYPHRHQQNVFYTTFENMKANIKSETLKIAKFIGPQYGKLLEQDNTVFNNVLKYSGLEYMKETQSDLYDPRKIAELISKKFLVSEGLKFFTDKTFSLGIPFDKIGKMEFVRKGAVGDWKALFSDEQKKRLDEKFERMTKGTDIPLLWENM